MAAMWGSFRVLAYGLKTNPAQLSTGTTVRGYSLALEPNTIP